MQDLIQQWVDVGLVVVRVDVEVGVAGEHGGQLRLGPVIEDVAGDAMGLGIGQLIAHAQRGTGALADQHVALAQPCGILVIDACITLASLLSKAQVTLAHMFGQHDVGALDIGDDAVIEVCIHSTPSN